MSALVEEFSYNYNYFLRVSGFPDLFGRAREFYMKRNNSKVASIKTGRIDIGHLFP